MTHPDMVWTMNWPPGATPSGTTVIIGVIWGCAMAVAVASGIDIWGCAKGQMV